MLRPAGSNDLVRRQCGSRRDVEGRQRTEHRNAHQHVAALADQSRQAWPLCAEHETDRFLCKITEVKDALVRRIMQTDDPYSRFLQLPKCRGETAHDAHRDVLDGSCRRLCGGGGDVHGSMTRKDDAIDPCPVARAEDRTEVPWISHTVDRNDERTTVLGLPTDEISEIGFGQFYREGDHTLRGLASRFTFEFSTSNLAYRDTLIGGKVQNVRHHRIVVEII